MPIFDYQCEACGHRFDKLQKLGAEPLTDCPECAQTRLKKLLSAPTFHLKGQGWRNSDDTPKQTNVRPKIGHMLDSPIPHADHHDEKPARDTPDHASPGGHGHSHDHGHSHTHSHTHDDKKD